MSLASLELQDGDNKMEINTRFGVQEVDPESVIQFPDGLPGFENLHEFKLFHEEGANTLLYLQSLEDAEVQLPVVDPDHFQVNYEIVLTDEEIAQLQVQPGDETVVLVTVANDSDQPTSSVHANFMGPIIINTRSRIGLQKALNQVSGTVLIRAD